MVTFFFGGMMCNLLVVDDDADNLHLFRRMLERAGIEAFYASNGEEALENLSGPRPIAVMITDLRMPYMDGLELAVRARQTVPDITVVMMTGHISPGLPQLALEAGIAKVVAKPLNPPEFVSLIGMISLLLEPAL